LLRADWRRHCGALAEDPRSSRRHECVGRFRRAAARSAGEMDVVDAGAADAGTAARRRFDAHEDEANRERRGRWPPHARGRSGADFGAIVMGNRLRILITGFGPFPGAPHNPTMPLVDRLLRLRRPAFDDVERSSHIFHVTYATVDRELPLLLEEHHPHAL